MAVLDRESREIRAKIVYFGAAGAGLTSNLQFIHRKLRKQSRGELRTTRLPGPPPAAYEHLAVELGAVRGYQAALQLYTVPGGEPHRQLRRELLDGVDGVVFVADLRPSRHEASAAALAELRRHLESYGRALDELALVVQYNRRDLADENALDALHRKLALKPAGAFEADASEGTGVLQTLTSLSKLVLQRLRQQVDAAEATSQTTVSPFEPTVMARDTQEFEAPPLAEPALLVGAPVGDISLEAAGPVEARERELRIPLRLVEVGSGRAIALSLRVALDPS